MQYIAHEGTYNEQIYDSTTGVVWWTGDPTRRIENCKPVMKRGKWRKLPKGAYRD